MIRVVKSADIPAVLLTKGAPATAENCRLYEINPLDYDDGKTTFKVNRAIYGHASVKQQLINEQHGKCCFCEADFRANDYGDIEHFRPKAGFTITRASKLIRPGYYWLAYEWTNLFFSCKICNQRFKKSYFPLDDETVRAKNHSSDYHSESPVLIHPSIDEPADHISFNRHIPVARTIRGKLSITTFGIDRPRLNNDREKYLQSVRNNIFLSGFEPAQMNGIERAALVRQSGQSWEIIQDLITTAKAFMHNISTDTRPFSAMVRANFDDLI